MCFGCCAICVLIWVVVYGWCLILGRLAVWCVFWASCVEMFGLGCKFVVFAVFMVVGLDDFRMLVNLGARGRRAVMKVLMKNSVVIENKCVFRW